MAEVVLSQLTALDIPIEWPEPLRRSLLDTYDQLSILVIELNTALESANAANELGASNSSEIALQSESVADLNIIVSANHRSIQANSRYIADVDRKGRDSAEGLDFIKSDYVSKSKATLQEMASSLGVTGNLSIDGEIVVIATQQGWSAHTGALQLGGMDSSAVYSVGAAYNQAEVLDIAAGLVEARKVINALSDALYSHHQLIGATPPP